MMPLPHRPWGRPMSDLPAAALPATRGVSRRLVIRWAFRGTMGLLAAQGTATAAGFALSPKLGSQIGTPAGRVDEYRVGDVRTFKTAGFHVSRVPEGFLAFWHVCPHDP